MEYQKNFGDKLTVGFGNAKTAGAGDLSGMEPVPKSMKYKHDRRAILKSAVKAAAVGGVLFLNHKIKKKYK
ncbi:MAG: hypothetical protein IJ874_10395 [Ruminococcus sp.]|nr:hypothetical protein [Ruminococcus sp.]